MIQKREPITPTPINAFAHPLSLVFMQIYLYDEGSSTSSGFCVSASVISASFGSGASACFLASISRFWRSISACFWAACSSCFLRIEACSSWILSLYRWMMGPAIERMSSDLETYCALVASSPSSYSQSYEGVSVIKIGRLGTLTSVCSSLAFSLAFSSSLANSAYTSRILSLSS